MRSEPLWLPPGEVSAINRREVQTTGEPHALLNASLLESACAKPLNRWYYEAEEDLVILAVCLLFGIARNHPFQQGNKRTGFVAALMFLNFNDLDLAIPDSDSLADAVSSVIERRTTEKEFADLLRPYVVALEL